MTDSGRELDLVIYGATGFVGRLLADYLARNAPDGVRIALAGRSQAKLEATRAALGPRAADWPIVIADADDPVALAELASRTRVVATTVGPYAKYGAELVTACVAAGTDYVDLTGEVLFVRESIDAHHDKARANGVKIVHSCGYDSIPSDLGVHVLHQAVQADGAGELTGTTLVASLSGGVSGGTIDSLRTQIDVSRVRGGTAPTRRLPVLAQPRPDEGTRPRPAIRRRNGRRLGDRPAGTRMEGSVRHGLLQHPPVWCGAATHSKGGCTAGRSSTAR